MSAFHPTTSTDSMSTMASCRGIGRLSVDRPFIGTGVGCAVGHLPGVDAVVPDIAARRPALAGVTVPGMTQPLRDLDDVSAFKLSEASVSPAREDTV
jgi:hypothetical protein